MKSMSHRTLGLALLASALVASPAAAGSIDQPIANANGPYTITIGDDLLLDGSGSIDSSFIDSWDWDLDDDGLYDDASGEMVTLLGATNYDGVFGTVSDGDMRTIGLRVTCGFCTLQSDVNSSSVTFMPEPGGALLVGIALTAAASMRRRR